MPDEEQYPQLLGGFRGPLNSWSAQQTIAAANEVISRFEGVGIRVPGGTRLRKAVIDLSRIERFDVSFGHGDSGTERLFAESTRTIFEQYVFLHDLQAPDERVRERLRVVIGGNPVPEDGHHDPARDAQAEFFAAALLFGSGFRVVSAEPDLVIGDATRQIPVAVKRMTSEKNFEKRMRAAKRQLQRFGASGYIVVSLDQLLASRYEMNRSADLSGEHYRKVAQLTDTLRLDAEQSPVLGVFGISTSFRHLPGTRRNLAFALHFHHRFVTSGQPEQIEEARGAGAWMAQNAATMMARIKPPS